MPSAALAPCPKPTKRVFARKGGKAGGFDPLHPTGLLGSWPQGARGEIWNLTLR